MMELAVVMTGGELVAVVEAPATICPRGLAELLPPALTEGDTVGMVRFAYGDVVLDGNWGLQAQGVVGPKAMLSLFYDMKPPVNTGSASDGVGNSLMELTVRMTFGGEIVAVLIASAADYPYELAVRLPPAPLASDGLEAMPGRARLVYEDVVLHDRLSLQAQGVLGPVATLKVVYTTSGGSIAQFLWNQRLKDEPDEALSAALADCAGPAAQHQHKQSEWHRPLAQAISRNLPAEIARSQYIPWMSQALSTMRLSATVFHTAVSILDRFLSALPAPISSAELPKITITAISLTLKSQVGSDHYMIMQYLIQAIPRHYQVTLPGVFRAEQHMFQIIGFVATVATPFDILQGLGVVLGQHPHVLEVSCWLRFGTFLLELVLLDARLAYRFPHAILAAAALSIGMRCLGAHATLLRIVMDGLVDYCPQLIPADIAVSDCANDVYEHWKLCTRDGILSHVFRQMQLIFAWDGVLAAGQLEPPEHLDLNAHVIEDGN